MLKFARSNRMMSYKLPAKLLDGNIIWIDLAKYGVFDQC
jgi:hypothetical protein